MVGVAVTQRASRLTVVTSVTDLHSRQQIVGRLQAGIRLRVTDDTAGLYLVVQAMRENQRIHQRLSSTGDEPDQSNQSGQLVSHASCGFRATSNAEKARTSQ